MTAPAIAPDAQELYRLEKERRAGRAPSPEMQAAKAEMLRLEALAIEQKKGGRPRNPFNVGKSTGRPRRTEPDPDAPGRPDWLTPPTPPKETGELPVRARRHSPQRPTMPTGTPRGIIMKTCARSGQEFEATGGAQKYCKVCPSCELAAAGGSSSKPTKKPRVEKPKKKRKPIRTGYTPEKPRPTRAASTSSILDQLKSELETVDARREHLAAAIDALVRLEGLE